MRIPNYDAEDDTVSNFKQLYDFMPNKCFRMLICGPSGSGKTNTLMHMIYNMLYFDKVYQDRYIDAVARVMAKLTLMI